jgi:hypothetical protein
MEREPKQLNILVTGTALQTRIASKQHASPITLVESSQYIILLRDLFIYV